MVTGRTVMVKVDVTFWPGTQPDSPRMQVCVLGTVQVAVDSGTRKAVEVRSSVERPQGPEPGQSRTEWVRVVETTQGTQPEQEDGAGVRAAAAAAAAAAAPVELKPDECRIEDELDPIGTVVALSRGGGEGGAEVAPGPHSPGTEGTASGPVPMGTSREPQSWLAAR